MLFRVKFLLVSLAFLKLRIFQNDNSVVATRLSQVSPFLLTILPPRIWLYRGKFLTSTTKLWISESSLQQFLINPTNWIFNEPQISQFNLNFHFLLDEEKSFSPNKYSKLSSAKKLGRFEYHGWKTRFTSGECDRERWRVCRYNTNYGTVAIIVKRRRGNVERETVVPRRGRRWRRRRRRVIHRLLLQQNCANQLAN